MMEGHGRRRFLLTAGALLAAPRARAARNRGAFRIAVFSSVPPLRRAVFQKALVENLARGGLVTAGDLRVEWNYVVDGSWPYSSVSVLQKTVESKPDVIVAYGDANIERVIAATNEIPVVMLTDGDPVAGGIAASLARPGGNVTGVAAAAEGLLEKRFALLKDVRPGIRKVAIVGWLQGMYYKSVESALRNSSRKAGVALIPAQPVSPGLAAPLGEAFASGAEAVHVIHPLSEIGWNHTLDELLRECRARKAPAIFASEADVAQGGLLAYRAEEAQMLSLAADQVVRVLQGRKPAQLPVQLSSRYELFVNLETAKAIDLTMPPDILLQATRVIG
jgi:putative ABC transport system substrate-binding protein